MILNLKNLAIWLAERIFVYNLRKRFFQNMQFLQNHKGNYGASCKPKNSTSMEQFFCRIQKACFKDISGFFAKNNIFSWLSHLKKPNIYMKFHKNSISCFWEKVVLTTWLTDWKSCLHKTPLCLKTRVQQYQ